MPKLKKIVISKFGIFRNLMKTPVLRFPEFHFNLCILLRYDFLCVLVNMDIKQE